LNYIPTEQSGSSVAHRGRTVRKPKSSEARPDRAELEAIVAAIGKSTAMIEFSMDGTILNANSNFLNAIGYTLDEIKGKHHSVLVSEGDKRSLDYRQFWAKLNSGQYQSAEYKRVGKGGREVWIQASYNPIFDAKGKPFKVVKFASDVTSQKLNAADCAGQLAAISKSSAVIEFAMDGTILAANDRFLSLVGYRLDEIKGRHHSIFVDQACERSDEYHSFWEKLKLGEFQQAEYKRLGKGGREVWIQASDNPILDLKGRPFKVVKYATDVTSQKLIAADFAGQIAAISKSTAVIEFAIDGTILAANDQFLAAMGYGLDEIKGKHHSIFVDEAFSQSDEYRTFWQNLKSGRYQQAEFKRLGKGGREVWIQASYNPILDLNGKSCKVVKYAIDVTRQKLIDADYSGQIAAIGKSTAVIEFAMDGTILAANDQFLSAIGYRLDEIKGQPHGMLVDEAFKRGEEYREFWEKLRRGEYQRAEYKRVGKGGREVWIQASYNPILDLNGKPCKVVKYATDITDQVKSKIELQEKVSQILEVVKAASQGDLTKEITVGGSDSIGQMGEALAHLFKTLRRNIQQILQHAQSVGVSAKTLMDLSNQMAGNAAATAGKAKVVSHSSGEVSRNVSVLVAGGEEMVRSIRLIAQSSNESARVAKEAVVSAGHAKLTISELGESSSEIGKVIKAITSIAAQTNMLALNATIEAARAGQAGKGFAVVAHEVKELAKETARATEEIGRKIEAIQSSTKSAVLAIGQIDSVINQVDDISVSIASAIEEQTATTNEMGRNVNEAARGATDIAQSIAGVAQTAEDTTHAADDTRNAAEALAAMASQLHSLVSHFKI